MKHHYHLYDLSSMGANVPEVIELDADNLEDAIKEVQAINRETWLEMFGASPEYGIDFRLVKLQKFKVSDDTNHEYFWAENADQAGRMALEDIFATTVEPAEA